MNIQHSCRSDLWGTPETILERMRLVFGGPPDLDPASDQEFNQRVRARRILTEEEDGLSAPWGAPGSVFLNPPGGKLGNKSLVVLFWLRLMEERAASPTFGHAIFMGFSVECLQTTQGRGVPAALEFPFCIPAKRLRFLAPEGYRNGAAGSPSHANVIVYVPGRVNRTVDFLAAFGDIGLCRG